MSSMKCRRGHTYTTLRCGRCKQLSSHKDHALRTGRPLCGNGHGLAGGNVAADGSCVECGDTRTQHPPDETWLDWAQVYQALQGMPLVRDLTTYEKLCAIHTMCVRNDWSREEACDWLRDNTNIRGPLTRSNAHYLFQKWAPKMGLTPVTVQGAVDYLITAEDDDGEQLAA